MSMSMTYMSYEHFCSVLGRGYTLHVAPPYLEMHPRILRCEANLEIRG